ncbi:DUF1189 domain-containing protein [Bacillus luteolus]|uniref:DUF1189 domain-containing protein n=1 Tax=Litchfieldia luteola TaxID=682179 RepID=A0ABR9QHM8_9BACI|nr:DUF1189 domain-containing protein [Cytobacillus luteolus]MBE4907989.1 DUF1189 domain-containing protein [Cytobacillus luteolus]MBP1942771.1 hypothetical protein [Cytobacillus luteolus]
MSIFKQFYKSLYSPKDIASFRFQGIGKTILFVFVLSLISLLPTGYLISTDISTTVGNFEELLSEDLPDFKIENGVLESEYREPYIIENNNFTFILDSSGELTEEDVESFKDSLVLLKNKALLVTDINVQTFDYSLVEGMPITSKELVSFFNTFKTALPIIIPVILLIFFIMVSGLKFIEVTFIALIGLILNNIVKLNLRFRHTWVMAAYSVTIPTVFFTIMEALRIQVIMGAFLNWFVAVIVLYLAMKEILNKKIKS